MLFYRHDIATVFAVMVASRLFYFYLGVGFDTSPLHGYMQFIDTDLLAGNLLESLIYYHANPPLLNLLIGLVLKVTDQHASIVLAMVFHLLGILASISVLGVCKCLKLNAAIAYGLVIFFAFSPAFILYENWLMYTFPAMAMLIFASLALCRFIDTSSTIWCVALFSSLGLMVLTRSVFHLAWFVGIASVLFILLRPNRKKILISALVPFLICFSWYGKNLYLFGTFSASTLLGLSLSNISTLSLTKDELQSMVDKGQLSEYALVSHFRNTEKLFEIDTGEPAGIEVLDRIRKSSGAFNFNHLSIIRANAIYRDDAFTVIRNFPFEYIRNIALANLLFFTPSGQNDYFSPEARRAVLGPSIIYDTIFFGAPALPYFVQQPHFGFSDTYRLKVGMGYFLFFFWWVSVLYAIIRCWLQFQRKGSGALSAENVVLMFMCANMLYVYSLSSLVELGENYRYKFLVEPLFYILVLVAVRDMFRFITKARKTRELDISDVAE